MTTPARYELDMTETFFHRSHEVPKAVWNKVEKDVFGRLREGPSAADPPTIKKLSDWRALWRYRLGKYRAIYKVAEDSQRVTLLDIGHRRSVYKRLGYEDGEGQNLRIASTSAPTAPTDDGADSVHDSVAADWSDAGRRPSGEENSPLPCALTSEFLEEAEIPQRFHQMLGEIVTDGALLNCDTVLGEALLSNLVEALYPSSAKPTLDKPTRALESAEDLAGAFEGERSLESFLLPLDESQQAIVERFREANPSGPWVVKGGPGTGKSTLALYCIRELLSQRQRQLFGNNAPTRILLTTYTKSLTALSSYLFDHIREGKPSHAPEITTIDSHAWQHLPPEWQKRKVIPERELQDLIGSCIRQAGKNTSFTPEDSAFVEQEITQVIFGKGVPDKTSYLEVSRAGRGRRLTAAQREDLWGLYEIVRKTLLERSQRTYPQSIAVAEHLAEPAFDYVFIDEAQDLSPSAVRLCIKLCKSPKRVFLTADLNQSLYPSGFSWAAIDKDLDMRGRSQILRRNFRTTVEICEAIQGLTTGERDKESRLDPENAVYHGEFPVFSAPRSPDREIETIERFLQQALLEERMSKNAAVVLCPSKRDCEEVAAALNPRFNAKFVRSSDIQFDGTGVRVMTIHAAKGLEFGVVVAARIDAHFLEAKIPPPEGESTGSGPVYDQRLLFVACSRAIRRLMVCLKPGPAQKAPAAICSDYWEIADR